ncbi:ATP-binding protein [Halobacillus yeomjeoni]|uniref:ATP-binding protein n=1 Tax=Halobacillus yeomjeoni TaxID=311194 RepID=UPI002E1D2C33
MIRERYSDQVHSGEILDILSLNSTPACLLDLRLQSVTLNQEMQETLQLENTNMAFAKWARSFSSTTQSELQQMMHHLLTEGLHETSLHVTLKKSFQKYDCKLVHLTNGQIVLTLISPYNDSHTNHSTDHTIPHSDNSKVKSVSRKTVQIKPRKGILPFSNIREAQLSKRMTHLVDKFPHGLAFISNTWDITYANPKMEELTGVSFEKSINKKLWDVYPVDEYYHVFQNYLRAMETQETIEFELLIQKTDIVVEMTVHPTELGLTVFAQDITQYKKHLQALKDSEERFAVLANNIKDVFWITDPDFKELHYVSPSFQTLFGLSRRDFFENPSAILDVIEGAHREKVEKALSMMREEKYQVEYKIKDFHGKEKWVRTRGFPVKNQGIPYVIGIHEDMTEYKEMVQLKEKSQQLSTISQMSAGIAHEIKNPLTAIKGFLQIGAANPELRDNYQEIILDEVNRIETIVQDFMMLSKPKSSIQLEEVELHQVISYVKRLLEPEAEEKEIKLTVESTYSDEKIMTEPKRLNQILINLVQNAIDAVGEAGEVSIDVKTSSEYITISVSDNGPGLTSQEIAKIGEPFFTTKEKGTGLGVMVSKKIVSDLNGTIEYESEKGEGTTVTVKLAK